jgi:DNA-directed RNA polymerase subunit RPC12/RpoP
MKIPTPIGQFITKTEIIICPDCQGVGMLFRWPDYEETSTYHNCPTCQGKRVLEKVEHVFYKRIDEPKTAPASTPTPASRQTGTGSPAEGNFKTDNQ